MTVDPKSGSGPASAAPRATARALVALARIAPTVKFYASGWFLGNLFYLFSRRYRRIVARNLDLAYGDELSKKQKRRIARASFVSFVQESLLMLKFVHLKSWQVEKLVEIENEDRLKDAFSQGRGVAFVTGHLSNFPLAIIRLVRAGYPLGVLRRKVKGRAGEELFSQLMSMVGVRAFYHKGMLLPLGRFLRDGGAVLFTIDQNARRGVQVPFFGIPASTFTAPVRFALSMNAVVLPIFMHREKRGKYVLTIEEPIELTHERSDQALHDNLLKLSLVLEKYVRMYPEQWFWLHRRWRHVKGAPS